MIRRVRDRGTFAALSRARPRRLGPLSVRFVAGAAPDPARVAYAVGRRAGSAVDRNRIRRRVRAAVHDHRALLVPGGAYLVSADRSAVSCPWSELSATVAALLTAAGSEDR